jgi:hydroxylamine dehydrogenase
MTKLLFQQVAIVFLAGMALVSVGSAQTCIECHKKATPNIVIDWQVSKHSRNGIECAMCHGDKHTSERDVAKAVVPTPGTCAACHDRQVRQFKSGKHAFGWAAMNAMPTTHWAPMALIQGQKGCGACHKVGLKSAEEIRKLREQGQVFGNASCDAVQMIQASRVLQFAGHHTYRRSQRSAVLKYRSARSGSIVTNLFRPLST